MWKTILLLIDNILWWWWEGGGAVLLPGNTGWVLTWISFDLSDLLDRTAAAAEAPALLSKSTACGAGARENIARLSQADTSTTATPTAPLHVCQALFLFGLVTFFPHYDNYITCQGVDQSEPDVHRKESLDTSILLDICVTLLITKLLVL